MGRGAGGPGRSGGRRLGVREPSGWQPGTARSVALGNDVQAYETIERGDLRTVRVAAGDGVHVVPVRDVHDVVGRVAASDLHEGSLLVEADLFAEGEKLIDTNEAVVGVRVGVGAAPWNWARPRRAGRDPTHGYRARTDGAAASPARSRAGCSTSRTLTLAPASIERRCRWWCRRRGHRGGGRERADGRLRSRRWRSDVPVLAMVSAKGAPGVTVCAAALVAAA